MPVSAHLPHGHPHTKVRHRQDQQQQAAAHLKRQQRKGAAPQLPGVSAAERRSQAQEEARWRAESDLRTLRQAGEKVQRADGIEKRAEAPAYPCHLLSQLPAPYGV